LDLKLLEGEYFVYKGYLWFIKGIQHPSGKVIAFPRYNLLNHRRDYDRLIGENRSYWDCLKIEVEMVDLNEVKPFNPRFDERVLNIVNTLRDLIGFNDYLLTGSTILGDFRDIDIVIYGVENDILKNVVKLIDQGVLKRSMYILVDEYNSKHRGRLDYNTYMYIKRDTITHLEYGGFHVNFKFTKYKKGFNTCIDRVYRREFFNDEIEIVEPVEKYVIPARYIVKTTSGEEYILETYREVYCELPSSKYRVEGFIEYRERGTYINIDHGKLAKT